MFSLTPDNNRKMNILCLGAHCDDIEIGCGGTLLRLIEEDRVARLVWVVFASTPERKIEAETTAHSFLQGLADFQIEVMDFPDTRLPFHATEIKNHLFRLKEESQPDLIFTHYRFDRHQDHKLLSDLCGNVFRNHLILEYEIPKYDADLGQPNYFVHLNAEQIGRKIDYLVAGFVSQAGKQWFDEETFKALLRIRGLESAAPQRYAEAFHLRKGVMTL